MDVGRSSFTKREFCQRNAISVAWFYKLRAQGKAPREMDVGRISVDAERDWIREREAEAAQVNKSPSFSRNSAPDQSG
jgi:predicted DNA-binding transcriptional regulator AlpA